MARRPCPWPSTRVTSHFGWSAELGEAAVEVPAGSSTVVPVVITASPDAWADEPVRVSVRARLANGRQTTAALDVTPRREAPPVAPGQVWPVPEALLGGLDVASLGLGAVTLPVIDPSFEDQLHDGLAHLGLGFWTDEAQLAARPDGGPGRDGPGPGRRLHARPAGAGRGPRRRPAPRRVPAVGGWRHVRDGPRHRGDATDARPGVRARRARPGHPRAAAHRLDLARRERARRPGGMEGHRRARDEPLRGSPSTSGHGHEAGTSPGCSRSRSTRRSPRPCSPTTSRPPPSTWREAIRSAGRWASRTIGRPSSKGSDGSTRRPPRAVSGSKRSRSMPASSVRPARGSRWGPGASSGPRTGAWRHSRWQSRPGSAPCASAVVPRARRTWRSSCRPACGSSSGPRATAIGRCWASGVPRAPPDPTSGSSRTWSRFAPVVDQDDDDSPERARAPSAGIERQRAAARWHGHRLVLRSRCPRTTTP